ncbi:hypothetical protein [Pseudoxanthomonas sacheonensis]|uniref:hypothetical protein n=1 Tax=Pseudoxanthomonas sacheonensis TaxID=443615 RepID=UPI0013D4DC37|nr:hypothetical protein [Pseudoxanthomonas sacheonensis]KAF1706909.1 hypothetical protein CSC73_13905 [Pseudoxanthomonas sacheonensis]
MSEPERRCDHHYFADYEVWNSGLAVAWGQVALTYRVNENVRFDPAELLAMVRQRAASAQCVEPFEIRVRSLTRL